MAEEDDRRSQENENADEPGQNGGNGGIGESVVGELRNAVREAAMEVLGPAARQATGSAARFAVKKGPEVMSKNVMPAVRERGGPGEMLKQATGGGGEILKQATGGGGVAGMAGKALSKVAGGGGGGAASGWGRNRRMPVQQVVYCSVPIRHAYNGWTEYNEWASYMHRANQVDEQTDDQSVRVKVTEKMWGFTRPFTAEVTAQKPDQYIRWESKDGTKHTGVINFHELGPRLTLIEVNLDHQPSGIIEKIARGGRFVKRAVRADFHRYKAWIEMKTEEELDEMEGWRGTVENGEIVKSHEDAVREEQEQEGQEGEPEGGYDEEPEGEAEEEPEGEAEEEPEAEAEEEPEGEAEEEPEAEAEEETEPPRARRRRSARQQEEPEQPRPRRRRASTAQREPEPASPRRRRSSNSGRSASGSRSGSGRGRSQRSSR